MSLMIIGLIVFLGAHSVRMVAPGWRERQIRHLGEKTWKGLYSLVSLAGLVVLIVGFGLARQNPVFLYGPAPWLRHLNTLFMLAAFILVTAAYVPGNHFKSWLGHPMLAGVCLWAFGHLLAAGRLHDVLLFGPFLLWAGLDLAVSRRRDRRDDRQIHGAARLSRTLMATLAGGIAWGLFGFWLHSRLIGVDPFG